jgi:Winged helix-turn helix
MHACLPVTSALSPQCVIYATRRESMVRTSRPSRLSLTLTPADRAALRRWRERTGRRWQYHIVLLRAHGMPIADIAARIGCSQQTVYTYLHRWQRCGLRGLDDQRPGRSGRRRTRWRRAATPQRARV